MKTLRLGVIAGLAAFAGVAWAQSEIRVGLLYPTSGVYAGPAKQGIEGATLAFEEAGNQVAGRKLVLVVEDDEAKPDVALAKAKKLVESDKVQVLMGVIWSPNAMALRPYVHERKVPLVLSEAAVRPITQEAGSPYIFRTSFASGQMTVPFGTYACSKLGYKKIVAASRAIFSRRAASRRAAQWSRRSTPRSRRPTSRRTSRASSRRTLTPSGRSGAAQQRCASSSSTTISG
jgi:branched-chain amino acid transport system substrate-binding protein